MLATQASEELKKSKEAYKKRWEEVILLRHETGVEKAIESCSRGFEIDLKGLPDDENALSSVMEAIRAQGYRVCLIERQELETEKILQRVLRVVIPSES